MSAEADTLDNRWGHEYWLDTHFCGTVQDAPGCRIWINVIADNASQLVLMLSLVPHQAKGLAKANLLACWLNDTNRVPVCFIQSSLTPPLSIPLTLHSTYGPFGRDLDTITMTTITCSHSTNDDRKMHILNGPDYRCSRILLTSLDSHLLCPCEGNRRRMQIVLCLVALTKLAVVNGKHKQNKSDSLNAVLTLTTKPHRNVERGKISSSWLDCGSWTVECCCCFLSHK